MAPGGASADFENTGQSGGGWSLRCDHVSCVMISGYSAWVNPGFGGLSAHVVTFQFDAIGVVDDAVKDGIGDGGLADHLMPA